MKCAKAAVLFILVVSYSTPPIHGIPLSPSTWIKRWSDWGKESVEDPHNDGHEEAEDDYDFKHVSSQLRSVICPSRPGRQLTDYWRCLWRTSLTAMGMEQDRRWLIESYYEAARQRPLQAHLIWKRKAEMLKQKEWSELEGKRSGFKSGEVSLTGVEGKRTDSTKRAKRKKREVNPVVDEDGEMAKQNRVKRRDEPTIREAIKKKYISVAKVLAFDFDLRSVLDNPSMNETLDEVVRTCQRLFVQPGISLTNFLACLRKNSPDQLSYLEEVQDAVYPEIYIPYDPREFILPSLDLNREDKTASNEQKYVLNFGYDRITQEVERYPQFGGADPYVLEQSGDFRYRFDNLVTNQQAPAWSYIGKNGAHSWHKQDIRKLFIPLNSNTDLLKETFVADLAQTYPGLGELGYEHEKLDTPMDYKWHKDSGYHSQTRYLIPIVDENDLTYYRYKGEVEESVTVKPDAEVLQEIIVALQEYENLTRKRVQDFPTVDDIPFINTYRDFLHHYYGIDTTSYLRDYASFKLGATSSTSQANETELFGTYEVIRQVSHSYVEAVVAQQKCLKVMVEKYHYEREADDVNELLREAQERCPVSAPNETVKKGDPYRVPNNTLEELYKKYFERKEARASYTLPVYPHPFPLCKSQEASPIDIIRKNGKKSSLRHYEFGEAGYRLNKFFMTSPNDGTPLLSVGIYKGERLDDSSVRLSGGAVKGQNLTFQYMFLRFASNWEIPGSEHQLDGKGAPMELQMVFTLAGSTDEIKYYHVLSRIQNELFQFREKLVIILSILVDVVKDDEALLNTISEKKTLQDPYLFEPLAQAAYHFRKEWEDHPEEDVPRGYVSQEPTFRLADFLPRVESNFYTYRGSLTWPPCFGYVVWSVYEQRLHISKRQFDQFARIPAHGYSDNYVFGDNYRAFEDIYVSEEDNEKLNYAEVLALKNKRTVNRYVLEGKHNPRAETKTATVDDEGYYHSVVITSGAPKITTSGGIVPAALIIIWILQFGLN